MDNNDYREIEYPSSRQLTFDVGRIGLGKHHVKALLEVDISTAWQAIRENRRQGEYVSFFVWLIKVAADCAAAHPPVAGFNRKTHNRVTVFDNVDVSVVLEKDMAGTRVPLPYVIRKANKKNLADIQAEVDQVKKQSVADEGDYVLGKKGSHFWMRLYTSFPQWLRLFLMKNFVLNNPVRTKQMMGNMMITTVGMVGHTHGWIIPYSMHPLCLAFGSINEQPLVRKGEITCGHILHMAVLVDHDVIDGVPAAAFVDDLAQKIEKGWGLGLEI